MLEAMDMLTPRATSFPVRSWSGRVTYYGRRQESEATAQDASLVGGGGSFFDYFSGSHEVVSDDAECLHCDEFGEDQAAMNSVSVHWNEAVEKISEAQEHGYESSAIDAQLRHRMLLERMAAEKAAALETRLQQEERRARVHAVKTQKLAQRAAARQKAKQRATTILSDACKHEAEREAAAEAALEAARAERVRATRRRQKEHYKRLLDELARKRRSERESSSAKANAEEAFRRKIKAAGVQRARRHAACTTKAIFDSDEEQTARGSGARAVRARQSSDVENGDETSSHDRRRTNRLFRDKQREYLEKMVAERRERETAREADALRLARRHKLRAERVLAEIEARRNATQGMENAGSPVAAISGDLKTATSKAKLDSTSEEEEPGEPGPRLTFSAQRALVERLTSTRLASCSQPTVARDFADWKRKHGIAQDRRVFVMTGWYPCVKDELIARGWVHNPDRDSPFFDLKWTLTSQHLRQSALEPWQYANHFQNTRSLVTKTGLSRTLASLQWYASETCDAIFPRCYDLSNAVEARAFVEDFRFLEALRVLRSIIRITARGSQTLVNGEVYAAAFALCDRHRRVLTAEDVDEDDDHFGLIPKAPAYLELLSAVAEKIDDDNDDLTAEVLASPFFLRLQPVRNRVDIGIDCRLHCTDDIVVAYHKDDAGLRTVGACEETRRESLRRRQASHREARARDRVVESAACGGTPLAAGKVREARRLLDELAELMPQAGLNGLTRRATRNLWIVKPAAKSRGRGIATFRNLDSLFEYCDMLPSRCENDAKTSSIGTERDATPGSQKRTAEASDKGARAAPNNIGDTPTLSSSWKPGGSMWIVQKYIENQLLVANRKFDLRQWVLVTKWNPLTIWFYDECYARFSAAEFTDDDNELQNEYVHLVNNSISKNSRNFHKKVVAENGVEVVDCMWTLQQFREYLTWRHERHPFMTSNAGVPAPAPGGGENILLCSQNHDALRETRPIESAVESDLCDSTDLFATYIQPAMQHISTCALMCAQDIVEHRAKSWELYGFDFMVDDTCKPWLIEINSSPACDYSTAVTESFVRRALVDILKVTFDHAEWSPSSGRDAPDTGGWKQIYVGPVMETPLAAFGGADIVCRGATIPEPRDFRRARLARQICGLKRNAASSKDLPDADSRSLHCPEDTTDQCFETQAPAPSVDMIGSCETPVATPIEGPAVPLHIVEHPPSMEPQEPASCMHATRKPEMVRKTIAHPHRKVPVKITTMTMDI